MENKTNDCYIRGSSIKCLIKKKTPYRYLVGILLFVLIIIGVKFYFFKDMSWKDFLLLKFLSGNGNKNDTPPPDITFGGQPTYKNAQCYIEGEDIFNGRTFTKTGTQIKDSPFIVDCSKCNKYVYKDSSGKCANYLYDKEEQEPEMEPHEWPGSKVINMQGKETGEKNKGMCEPNPIPSSTSCPF